MTQIRDAFFGEPDCLIDALVCHGWDCKRFYWACRGTNCDICS